MIKIFLIVTLFVYNSDTGIKHPVNHTSVWNGFEDCIKAGENLSKYFGKDYIYSCEYFPPQN